MGWSGPGHSQGRCRSDSAPGVKHWHGATPTTAMTHIAVQESLNGVAVDWLEQGSTNSTSKTTNWEK
jgi:hypothetical protein